MFNVLQQMGVVAILSVVVSVIPAPMGVVYAIRPNEPKLALMRPLSLASLFAALGGFIAGLINLLRYAAEHDSPPLSTPAMMMGTAESLVPLFVSFGSLTVAWLLVALGLRRTAQ
jgi:hypothetical protein